MPAVFSSTLLLTEMTHLKISLGYASIIRQKTDYCFDSYCSIGGTTYLV